MLNQRKSMLSSRERLNHLICSSTILTLAAGRDRYQWSLLILALPCLICPVVRSFSLPHPPSLCLTPLFHTQKTDFKNTTNFKSKKNIFPTNMFHTFFRLDVTLIALNSLYTHSQVQFRIVSEEKTKLHTLL